MVPTPSGKIDGCHLSGQRIEDLALLIFIMIPKRIANKRTAAEALENMRWVGDIHGVATIPVLVKFLSLWDLVSDIVLQQGAQDTHV